MDGDAVFAIVSFVVGLAIGLFQLYVAQRQFESQQQDRMTEIQKTMTDIQQRLAVMESISSQRSFDMQDKLLTFAMKQEAVTEVTEDTSGKIRDLVLAELQSAGVSDAVERTKSLEERVTKALEKSNKEVIERTSGKKLAFSAKERRILSLATEGMSSLDISKEFGMTEQEAEIILKGIAERLGFSSVEVMINQLMEIEIMNRLHSRNPKDA